MTATSPSIASKPYWLAFWRLRGSNWIDRLVNKPADITSLAGFRILFGLLMCAAMIRFLAKGWVREWYVQPLYHFTYPGFGWVRPWPDFWMHAHFVLLAVLALCIAAGFLYRVCAVLFFLGFTYVELLDQTAYLNHYYLISLLSGLLALLPANRAWSLDVLLRPAIQCVTTPAWTINILRFQVAVVYVFAGLAKLNADWLLRAEPLRIWLAARSDLPIIGPWLEQVWVAYVASWFGAIFDTSIVFFMVSGSARTRRVAYCVLVVFHVATWFLFNIGMFPWIMIVTATVLFPTDWPRYWLGRWSRRILLKRLAATTTRFLVRRPGGSGTRSAAWAGAQCRPWFKILLGAYVLIQMALPLRPWLGSQPAGWTCSGFNCAWQVMIVEKTGYSEFYAVDRETGGRRRIEVERILTARQKMMMDQDPFLIRDMARWLARRSVGDSGQAEAIRVESFATFNGRPGQRLVSPNEDLAGSLAGNWIERLER